MCFGSQTVRSYSCAGAAGGAAEKVWNAELVGSTRSVTNLDLPEGRECDALELEQERTTAVRVRLELGDGLGTND